MIANKHFLLGGAEAEFIEIEIILAFFPDEPEAHASIPVVVLEIEVISVFVSLAALVELHADFQDAAGGRIDVAHVAFVAAGSHNVAAVAFIAVRDVGDHHGVAFVLIVADPGVLAVDAADLHEGRLEILGVDHGAVGNADRDGLGAVFAAVNGHHGAMVAVGHKASVNA